MHSVTLNPFSRYYHHYFLVWYVLLSFLVADRLHALIIILLCSPAAMLLYFWLKGRAKKQKPLRGYRLQIVKNARPGYSVSEKMLYLSLILLIGICLLGKLMPESLVLEFLIASLFFVVIAMTAIYFFVFDSLIMTGKLGDRFKSLFAFIFRTSWLLVFFFSYATAKNAMMEVMDITFEAAATKVTVILLACIYFGLLYFSLIMSFSFFLNFFESKETVTTKRIKYIVHVPAWPFFLLIISSWAISYAAFNINLHSIFSYVMKRTVAMDTRDTFFCNDRYLTIPALPGARYLNVAENDYRIFSPSSQIYSTWRLKCSAKPPGYRYWPVMSAEHLTQATLQQKIKLFKQDVDRLQQPRH